jgi:hypothetical protein
MKKLSLEKSSEPFHKHPNGHFEFINSFLKLKSQKLRINDNEDTGLPNKNFIITFEFKTDDKDAPLFSINSPIGDGGHDKQIFLRDGEAVVQISPSHQFTCKKQDLADGQWHLLELFCLQENPVRVMIDGTLSGENSTIDHSDFDWALGICIGYSDEVKDNTFSGSIRNLKYEECNILRNNKEMTFEELYDQIQKPRSEFEAEKETIEQN